MGADPFLLAQGPRLQSADRKLVLRSTVPPLTSLLHLSRKFWLGALVSGAGLVLSLAPGCELPSCEATRTCSPGPGGGGQVGSGGGADVAAGGAAGEGGQGGAGASGNSDPTLGSIGGPCQPLGSFACAQHGGTLQLVCEADGWAPFADCSNGELCDTRAESRGACQPVVPECEEHEAGDRVCRGKQRLECGVDLVTASSLGICDSGCGLGECSECVPGEAAHCDGNRVVFCDESGVWAFDACDAETPRCLDGACTVPPSCEGLGETCGPDGDEPCCTSPLVQGGDFARNNNPARPATVSDFRLDRFEVTVGRFRKFDAAWEGGWRPDGGAGKHAHLNGGLGLVDETGTAGYETGWSESDVPAVVLNDLDMESTGTWSVTPGARESHPIVTVSPAEAHTFCIWDGGFLPSNAEWSYAASGGDEQRTYPWGEVAPGDDAELAVYGCFYAASGTCAGIENIAPVGTASGEGRYGQLDLAGNVAEWVLGPSTASSCIDCVRSQLQEMTGLLARGADFMSAIEPLENATEGTSSFRSFRTGFRCARSP